MKSQWRIAFTQYLRPNGRRKIITIGVSPVTGEKAARIAEAGYKFEAEILTTGQVSLTISGQRMDVAIEIVANKAEAVHTAVDRMVAEFDFERAAKMDREDDG